MLVEKFEDQVKKTPGNIAVKTDTDTFTYAELNRYANGIAQRISEHVRGKTVGLLFEHSVHMIAAILGALKAGKTYVPLSVDYPAARLSYMLTDSGSSLVLTNTANERLARMLSDETGIPVHCFDPAVVIPGPEENPSRTVSPDDNAYILYTSGSTGKPKGVCQTHRNVDYFIKNWVQLFSVTPSDRLTLFSSFCHDASVMDIYSALHSGASLFPLNMKNRENTTELSEFLVKEQITIWHSVPSLFSYFANTLTGSDTFPDLRFILLGGEAVRKHEADLLKRFFPHCTMGNIYGQTESSFNSLCMIRADTGYDKPVIGTPLNETEIYVIDDEGDPVGSLETGEILIGCNYVSPGYWRDPETTQKVFAPDDELGRLYWTGDIGRLLVDGSIEFLGRRDTQIKIRGFRVELGEIETQLLKHDQINEAVVIAREDKSGDKYLSAYIVTADKEDKLDVQQLRRFIADELPDYMIPSHFVFLDKMPLTPNGKIDRKSLPEPGPMQAGDDHVAPRDKVEEELTVIWSDVLDIQKDTIGIDADFFQLGGHSLKATIVISKIHKALDIRVPLAVIFKAPTIRGLADYIKNAAEETYIPLANAPVQDYYPLTSPQRRLFILQQLDDSGTGYNLPSVVELEGNLDIEKLEETFRKMIKRHESLRTSFRTIGEEPVQHIHDEVEFEIECYDLAAKNAKEREDRDYKEIDAFISRFIRAFDLTQVPLLRVGLITITDGKYVLMVDMHHIITDGISIEIFIKEFIALYAGETLAPLRFQYKDFSVWRNSDDQQTALKGQENYWVQLFQGEIPVLNLPYDFPRPTVQRFEGRTIAFELDALQTGLLKETALTQGVTLYMLLLSLLNVWLSKLSSQDDIVIGTPIAGRRHVDLERVIGMFVNTLALRNSPTGDKTVAEFLEQLKSNTLEAFDYQDYQFEDLVEKISLQRDTSRNPLFDVMFMLRNFDIRPGDIPVVEIEELTLKPYRYERKSAKFDLDVTAAETADHLLFNVEYSTNLFKEETIQRFIGYFKNLVGLVLSNCRLKLSEVEILSAEEKKQILDEFNNTTAEYPKDKTIHQLFEEQVEKTPERMAVVSHFDDNTSNRTYKTHMTYKDLNEKANALASDLTSKGVTAGNIVGIMVERSLEMMVGIMGILKAGGAYLPIDPDCPEERKKYMLADSGANVLLTHRELTDVLTLKTNGEEKTARDSHIPSSNLAYVIYTSGTTGKPKGVLVEHHSVINRLKWMQKRYPIGENDTILQKTPYTFDVSVWELFWWAIEGARVCLLVPGGEKDPAAITDAIKNHHVTVLHFVPSMLRAFLDAAESDREEYLKKLSSLKQVFASGEALPLSDVDRFNPLLYSRYSCRLANLYGPTEATVDVSYFDCSPGEGLMSVPIGKPIDNIKIVVVDKYGHLQPIGIAGELYISGCGLARGYLNRPGLTSEKFVYPSFLPEERFYRTGDLVKWLPDGNVEFLGRIDHQVKIRGFRIELGEIENRLQEHENVSGAVVITRDDGSGDKCLCAYIVTTGESGKVSISRELNEYLAKKLPTYMIPSYFMEMDSIPLTSNGKINRKALPEPDIRDDSETFAAPQDQIEEQLAALWSEILGIDKDRIGVNTSFFQLGGHSLKANLLVSRIHRGFDVNVPLAEVFRLLSIRGLSGYIKEAAKDKFISIAKAENKDYYALSSAQERLYVLQKMDPASTGYNMPLTVVLEGETGKEKLTEVFNALIHRHESLRTSFQLVQRTPVQKIHEDVAIEIEFYDLAAKNAKEREDKDYSLDSIISRFIRAFDLATAPLLRVGLFKVDIKKHILVVDMHHIISDAVSHQILVQDFVALYRGEQQVPLKLQYKDYSEWLNSPQEKARIKQQENYWLDRFSGALPVLKIPTDFPRPAIQSFEGSIFHFCFESEQTRELKTLARQQGITLQMLMLAIFQVLLAKLSGQDDIVTGTTAAGRSHADLMDIIGIFVNTLALRNFPSPNKTLGEFLTEVKDSSLKAYQNQGYPFDELVKKLIKTRDNSRNPIFDILFEIQEGTQNSRGQKTHDTGQLEIPGLKLRPYYREITTTKFDMDWVGIDTGEKISFTVMYCIRLFTEESVQLMTNRYKALVESVLTNGPLTPIDALDFRTVVEEELDQVEEVSFNF